MRIYFGLTAFDTPTTGADLPYHGTVVGGGLQPDDWTAIVKDPRFGGAAPVAGSFLSFRLGGALQAVPTVGAWETPSFNGGYFAVEPTQTNPDGTVLRSLQGPYPYLQVS